LVIVQTSSLSTSELDERIRAALAGRTVIEQAKGVLAEQTGVDMAEAYRLLVQRARANQVSLTDAAVSIIQQAQRRR
jgi:AmiR/NasT family two-component response regulator